MYSFSIPTAVPISREIHQRKSLPLLSSGIQPPGVICVSWSLCFYDVLCLQCDGLLSPSTPLAPGAASLVEVTFLHAPTILQTHCRYHMGGLGINMSAFLQRLGVPCRWHWVLLLYVFQLCSTQPTDTVETV